MAAWAATRPAEKGEGMAILAVTEQEMVKISEPWVKCGSPARSIIETSPLLARLLPRVEAAHAAVSAVHEQLSSNATQINTAMIGWLHMVNRLVTAAQLAGIAPDADQLLFSALRTVKDDTYTDSQAPAPPVVGQHDDHS